MDEVDSDEGRDFDSVLRDITFTDDKREFVSMMKGFLELDVPFIGPLRLCPHDIFMWVCRDNAVDCAATLLEGEMGWTVDLNIPFSSGKFPLHLAVENQSFPLTELFLKYGARTDVRANGVYLRNGLLPLNFSLEMLRFHRYLVDWTPKESIFKLITILCLPQMKVPLEVSRLLALNTKETYEVLYHYAMDGKLIEMAVLLMVAREKVPPIVFQSIDGRLSIHQCIKEEIAFLVEEEVKLMGIGKNSELIRLCKEKKAAMVSALVLLEVFDRAGEAFEAYLQPERTNVTKDKVVEDVTYILAKAGFVLKDEDTDLNNIYWIPYDGKSFNVKLALKKSESTTTFNSQQHDQHMPLHSPQGSFPDAKRQIIDLHEKGWPVSRFFLPGTPNLLHGISTVRPFSKTSFRYEHPHFFEKFFLPSTPNLLHGISTLRPFSKTSFRYEHPHTFEKFVNGRIEAEQPLRHLQSRKKVVSFALAIKRGMKRV